MRNLTEEVADRLGYKDKDGVLIESVDSGSEAAEKRLRPGMLITQLDKEPVKNVDEFERGIEKALEAGRVLLLVTDGRSDKVVVLKLPKESDD